MGAGRIIIISISSCHVFSNRWIGVHRNRGIEGEEGCEDTLDLHQLARKTGKRGGRLRLYGGSN
jgi:hypothetical protein